jgi:hypothetical protein
MGLGRASGGDIPDQKKLIELAASTRSDLIRLECGVRIVRVDAIQDVQTVWPPRLAESSSY